MKQRDFLLQLLSLSLLLLLLAACAAPPVADNVEIGIPVTDLFRPLYEELGGRAVFGDVLEPAFPAPDDGRLLQYFDNFRLEQDPDTGAISVSPLGVEILPETIIPTDAENAAEIASAFDQFYAEHDGERLLGPAISPLILEGTRTVQYFQNGRLDWYPELPAGSRVVPGQLGLAHFADKMAAVLPDIRDNIVVPAVNVTAVAVFASVSQPVLYSGDTQTLTIKIINQDGGESVSDLRIEAVVRYGDAEQVLDLGITQEESLLHLPLAMTGVPAGVQVDVEVNVYAPGNRLVGSDSVAFQTWW